MSLISRLKNVFSGKKNRNTQDNIPVQVIPPVKSVEDTKTNEASKEIKLPEGERKEKKCPFCAAPNDTFVSMCWLCKKKI